MHTSSYAWIITEDRVDASKDVGLVGPRNANPALVERLKAGEGAAFRMLDDDGERYYSGRLIHVGTTGDDTLQHADGFEPLDDYGTPNAGCTTIQFKDAHGVWADL